MGYGVRVSPNAIEVYTPEGTFVGTLRHSDLVRVDPSRLPFPSIPSEIVIGASAVLAMAAHFERVEVATPEPDCTELFFAREQIRVECWARRQRVLASAEYQVQFAVLPTRLQPSIGPRGADSFFPNKPSAGGKPGDSFFTERPR